VAGTAHVVSASEPPASSLYGRCELHLVVDAPGMAAAAVKIRDPRVPVAKWPDAGTTLPIMVAVDDPRRIRIQWDDMPTHAEAAADGQFVGEYGEEDYSEEYPEYVPPSDPLDIPLHPTGMDPGDPATADMTDDLLGLHGDDASVSPAGAPAGSADRPPSPAPPPPAAGPTPQAAAPSAPGPAPPAAETATTGTGGIDGTGGIGGTGGIDGTGGTGGRSRTAPRPRPEASPETPEEDSPVGGEPVFSPRVPPGPVPADLVGPTPGAGPAGGEPEPMTAEPSGQRADAGGAPRPRPRPRPSRPSERASASEQASDGAGGRAPGVAPAGTPTRHGAMTTAAQVAGVATAAATASAAAATGTAVADPEPARAPGPAPGQNHGTVGPDHGVSGPDHGQTLAQSGLGEKSAEAETRAGPSVTAIEFDLGELVTGYSSARPGQAGAIHGVGITVLVRDLARSAAFYRDMLGFYEIDGGDGSVVLASGDTRVVLRAVHDVPPVDRRLVHINLEVADVHVVYEQLKAKGVRFTYGPRPTSRGERLELWAAAFHDPDGHGIAITQWRTRGR
jgi:catechol 2,3-dioxygenase-like lactoylglutathione lyase family enzyme